MSAANPMQRTGRAYIYVNGTLYESDNDAKLTGLLGVKRNVVKGATVYGFNEEALESTVQASFFHGGALSIDAIRSLANVTVTFACDTGATYTLRNAWVQEIGEFTAKDGKVSITFAAANPPDEASS